MMIQQSHETMKLVMHHLPLFRQVLLADVRDLFGDYPDLTPAHIHSLMFLMIGGDTTMTRLSQLLRMEKGSVTAVTARMMQWGFVSKETDPKDRRKSILRLTDHGRCFAESVRSAQAVHFSERIERLTAKEQQQFFDQLKHLNELLMKMGDPEELRCFFDHPEHVKQPGSPGIPLDSDCQRPNDTHDLTAGGTIHA